MTFSIVIPAYNESDNLLRIETELLPQLDHDHIDSDILIVNDGSTDNTGKIAEELAARHKNINVVHHPKNMGLGAALRTGYGEAEQEWIITIDADLSYSPNQIANLVNAMSPEVDAVFGSPYMRGGYVKDVSSIRIIPSKAVNLLYSIVLRKRLTCWTGMFRAVRRKAIRQVTITQDGFDGVAEIAIRLAKAGFRIVEVPAVLQSRIYGESKSIFKRELIRHLRQLMRVISHAE